MPGRSAAFFQAKLSHALRVDCAYLASTYSASTCSLIVCTTLRNSPSSSQSRNQPHHRVASCSSVPKEAQSTAIAIAYSQKMGVGKDGKKRVVIIGAGIGGVSTAARLAKAGLEVIVVEKVRLAALMEFM